MKPTRTHSLIALAASLAFLAAGCGSSGGGSATTTSSTSASATDTWASGVCSSIATWQAAIKSAAGSVKSDPTKNGLQTAAGDAKAATETLTSDLKGQGKPDTQSGQQAKDSLDQLSTTLQQNMTTIESTVEGISGLKGALTAVPTVTSHTRDDGNTGQDDVRGARRQGRAEERVRQLERLQLSEEQRLLIVPGSRRSLGRARARRPRAWASHA